MEQSWLVSVGRIGLYAYHIFILALLVGLLWQRAVPRHGARVIVLPRPEERSAGQTRGRRSYDLLSPWSASRWIGVLRFTVEYLGNLDVRPESTMELDRRRNIQARILMEHIREDLASRGVTSVENDHLIAKLRESIRSVGTGRAD